MIHILQDVAKVFKKCKEDQSTRLDLSKSQVSIILRVQCMYS